MRSVCLVLALATAMVLLGAAGAPAQVPSEDPFLKGLRDRGLSTLMEAYLKQQGAAAMGTGTRPGAAPGEAAGKVMLAALEVQKAANSRNIGEREGFFKKARDLYEGAIEDTIKAAAAAQGDERHRQRLAVLKLRLELANMVFDKWLTDDLDFLEITDRRGGDRAHAADLLKVCTDQYKAISNETAQWLSEIDRMTMAERSKFANTGCDRQLKQVQRQAKFDEARALYYYGWVLPADYKPAPKERSRKDILNDAITAFQAYTSMPDKVAEKWYALMVIGMAYRELGKYDEVLQSLAQADNSNAPEGLRIRIAYERALTLLRKGEFQKARDAVDEAAAFWKDKLKTERQGLALPFVKGEAFVLEGEKKGDENLKNEGFKVFEAVRARQGSWPQLVSWVMTSLRGGVEAPVDIDKLHPTELWDMAVTAMEKARDSKDPASMEKAATFFKAYADRVGSKDKNYPMALYSQAACLLQLVRKAEAADLFHRVADEFPAFQYAPAAGKYDLSIRGEVYENAQTDENRQAYEDALKWFLSKYPKDDPEQQYFYGVILFRGKKYTEAADTFSRVLAAAEHYPDARYWVPLCRLEQFREKILVTGDKQLILSRARAVAQELLAFADYAFKATVADEKKKQLLDWAQAAYINAADVYLYPEVSLPGDALPLLEAMEKKFTLDDEARGRVLKLRIDAYQKLGDLAKAQQILKDYIRIATPAEVGPVVRGLFHAIIDDVRELITRGQKDQAADKVEGAKQLGEILRDWLDKSTQADKALRIENNRYDLAELFLAVGKTDKANGYEEALKIYKDIGGDKPWVVDKTQALKLDCIYGMGRAYEGLGDTAPDAAQAKPNYETALDIWRVLLNVSETERGGDPNVFWERLYHAWYCSYRVGNVKDVYLAMVTKAKIIYPLALGGKDPVLQKKCRDLLGIVSAAGTGAATPAPSPPPPPAAPAPAAPSPAPDAAPAAAAPAP
jgi:hypothetical protein